MTQMTGNGPQIGSECGDSNERKCVQLEEDSEFHRGHWFLRRISAEFIVPGTRPGPGVTKVNEVLCILSDPGSASVKPFMVAE